jgi:uncharacterized protein
MQTIGYEQLSDIARGSAVLAAGGGGEPFRGHMAVQATFDKFGPTQLVGIDELDDDALIASPFLIGAPVTLLEKFPFGDELVRAARELERRTGRTIEAVYAVEAGGVNSMVPFSVAARMGIPVLDADTMGRAYPAMDLTLVNLAGIQSTPIVMTDDYGSLITIDTNRNEIAETLGRAMTAKSGAVVAAAGFMGTAAQMRPGLAEGTISLAQSIGSMLRKSTAPPTQTWDQVLELTGGRRLFEGKVVSAGQDIESGWGVGTTLVEGTNAYEGLTMRIDVINEYLTAVVNGEALATAPDIITVYDAANGAPITSESVRYGFRIGVVAIPCDPRWTQPDGIALGGPARLGFDHDYVDFRTTTDLARQTVGTT